MTDSNYLDFYLNGHKMIESFICEENESIKENIKEASKLDDDKMRIKKEQIDIQNSSFVDGKMRIKNEIIDKVNIVSTNKSVRFSSPCIENSSLSIQNSPSFEQIIQNYKNQSDDKIKSVKRSASPLFNESIVKKEKCLNEKDNSPSITSSDQASSYKLSIKHSPTTLKEQQKMNLKRKLDYDDIQNLPPRKRFLKQWNSQTSQIDKNDFSNDQSIDDLINKRSSNAQSKITNYFNISSNKVNKVKSSSLNVTTNDKDNNKTNKFSHFKLPTITKIAPDPRIQNNTTFKIVVEKYSDLFQNLHHFNEVQIRSMSPIFETNYSLIIKSPNLSGKSTVLEFAIIKLMNNYKPQDFKVLILLETKQECKEKFKEWQKFQKYGLDCCLLIDDAKLDENFENNCSLIICTPEKIEYLTRNVDNLKLLMNNLKLVLIEEINFMSNTQRGHVLEAIICRLKLAELDNGECLRWLVETATIDRLDPLLNFFGPNTRKLKFGDETRDIPLRKIVMGYNYPANQSEFSLDKAFNIHLTDIIRNYQKGQQVLVFCPTRKITEETADHLKSGNYNKLIKDQDAMLEMAKKITTKNLRECMLFGVAYHHSGLVLQDRHIVEKAYKNKLISILCCTTSSSINASLSNLVILKGTFRFNNSKINQYDQTDINKLIGNTGKLMEKNQSTPPATAIIMTKSCYKNLYDRKICDKMLESNLRDKICEFITVEISLNHLKSFEDVYKYVKLSYLFICMQENPQSFGILKPSVDDATKQWINEILNDMKLYNVIKSENRHQSISIGPVGLIMNEYCINFRTIKKFSKINTNQTINSLLFLICQCEELINQSYLRNDEKSFLNQLNSGNNLKFPIRNNGPQTRISDLTQKLNCLIQSYLGDLFQKTTSQQTQSIIKNLIQETIQHLRIAKCLSKALVEYLFITAGKSFPTFKNAILLYKSIHAGIWYDSTKQITKQIPKIGPALSSRLDEAGYNSFDKLKNARAIDIETHCNRQSPFGLNFIEFINKIPDYELKISQSSICSNLFQAELIVRIVLLNPECKSEGNTWLLVGDEENNLLFFKKIVPTMFNTVDNTIEFEYQAYKVKNGLLNFELINESFVGNDKLINFTPVYSGIINK